MNRLLTPGELSELLNVKRSTIYQWSSSGFVPKRKLGRLLRFDEQDIERWLARRASGGRLTKRVKFSILSGKVKKKVSDKSVSKIVENVSQ